MNKFLMLIILLLFISGCSKSPEDRKNNLYEKGLSYIEQFDFDAANASFKEIANIDPVSPLGLYGEGLVFERKLQYYDALSIYLILNDALPNFAPAFAGAFRTYTFLGHYDDAVEAANTYYRLLPDDPEAKKLLVKAYFNQGNYKRALHEQLKIIKLSSDEIETLRLIMARIYYLEGNHDSARSIVDEVFIKPPNSSKFYYEAANYFEDAKLIDSSIALSKIAHRIDEDNFEMSLNHFNRLIRNKYFYEARKIIRNLVEKKVPATIIDGMELSYYFARDDKNKLRDKGVEYHAKNPDALSAVIYEMQSRGEVGDLLSVSQDYAAYNALVQKGNYDIKFKEFFNYVLALIFSKYEKDTRTIANLQEIKGIRSNSKELKIEIAFILYTIGEFDKSLEMLKQLERFHLDKIDWLTDIANIYSHRGVRKYEKAEQLYKKVLKINNWYLPAFENYVEMFHRQEKYKKALKIFDKYPYFEKNYPEIAIKKAVIYLKNDQIDKGLALFESNIIKVKGNIDLYSNFISILKRKNRTNEIEHVTDLLKLHNSENSDALVFLAEYNNDYKEYSAALEQSQKAIAFEPDNPSAQIQKARALYYLGEKSEAIEIFENNITRFNSNPDNLYYFSRVLADEKKDFNRASNMAREAVFNSYGSTRALLNLSYIYYQMGRYNLSRGEAMKARNFDRTNPTPYFRIGLAMYHEGKDKAKENLLKAIELGLKGNDRDTALYVLEKLK